VGVHKPNEKLWRDKESPFGGASVNDRGKPLIGLTAVFNVTKQGKKEKGGRTKRKGGGDP